MELTRARVHVAFAPNTSDLENISFFQSPVVLLAPPSILLADARRSFRATNLVAATFTVEALLNISKKVENPVDGDRRPVVFFGKLPLQTIMTVINSFQLHVFVTCMDHFMEMKG